jgi:hypothetical protein
MKVAISPPFGQFRVWGILLLIVSVGVTLPILLRTLFNRRAVEVKQVALVDFVAHQQRLVVVSISAAYVTGVAYLLLVPNLYLYGSVLAGLYGIYSAIPSERKLKGSFASTGWGTNEPSPVDRADTPVLQGAASSHGKKSSAHAETDQCGPRRPGRDCLHAR